VLTGELADLFHFALADQGAGVRLVPLLKDFIGDNRPRRARQSPQLV